MIDYRYCMLTIIIHIMQFLKFSKFLGNIGTVQSSLYNIWRNYFFKSESKLRCTKKGADLSFHLNPFFGIIISQSYGKKGNFPY